MTQTDASFLAQVGFSPKLTNRNYSQYSETILNLTIFFRGLFAFFTAHRMTYRNIHGHVMKIAWLGPLGTWVSKRGTQHQHKLVERGYGIKKKK